MEGNSPQNPLVGIFILSTGLVIEQKSNQIAVKGVGTILNSQKSRLLSDILESNPNRPHGRPPF